MTNDLDESSQSSHLLSLKWNNHLSNFRIAIASLQEKAMLSDATIACDGHLFPVHKLVLSTCSDFFAQLFSSTPCKHPVVVLHDLPHQNFNYLLSYMYAGEVNVPQAHLPTLIKAAETLQIKGLAAPDEEPAQGLISVINNHAERNSSLSDKNNSKILKKRKNYLSGSASNCNQQSSSDSIDNVSKRLKKSFTNDLGRRESSPDEVVLQNDHQQLQDREFLEMQDNVKEEKSPDSSELHNEVFEEQSIRVKEEGESSDRDLDDSVAQVWQQQQGSTAVSWSNESASDLSWLPFTAARDRMGLLMEVKDHGEGSLSDGALRMSRAQVNPDGGAASEDLPPLLLSPSAVTSLTSEAPVDAASMDTSNKSNKINWASSDSHRRRTSFDGCNGSDLRNSSLIFDANRGEGKSLVGTGGAFNFFSGMAPSKLGHGRVAHRQLLCPYPQCGYVTDRDSWLKTHMRKHTGERPFSCPHCPYRSAQKSNLTVHVRKVHAKDREEFQHFNAVPGTSVPFDRWPSNDSMSDHSMPALQHPSHSTIEQATTRPSSSSTSFSVVDLQSAHLDALGALMNLPSSSLQIPSYSEQLSSPPNNSTRTEATSQDTVSSIAEIPRLSKSQS